MTLWLIIHLPSSLFLFFHSFPQENTLFPLPLIIPTTSPRRKVGMLCVSLVIIYSGEEGDDLRCPFFIPSLLLLTLGESELLFLFSIHACPVSRRCCKEWTKVKCIEDEVQLSSERRTMSSFLFLCWLARSDDVSSSFMWDSFYFFSFFWCMCVVRWRRRKDEQANIYSEEGDFDHVTGQEKEERKKWLKWSES